MRYFVLLATFFGSIGVCFSLGLKELLRPTDAGPLPIDRTRDVRERHFGDALRKRAGESPDVDAPLFVTDILRLERHAVHPGSFIVREDAFLPPGTRVTGIAGDQRCVLEEGSEVTAHVDAVGRLEIHAGARVGGRATSSEEVVLHPGAELTYAAAPRIIVVGGKPAELPAPSPRAFINRDDLLRISVQQAIPLDAIVSMARLEGTFMPGVEVLLRAEALQLLDNPPFQLAPESDLSWLAGESAWYLGAGTIRITGDLQLPKKALFPGHMIVDGDLFAGADCEMHGSIHVGGDAILGPGCTVGGNIAVKGSLRLAPGVSVAGAISASGTVDIDARCRIGVEGSEGVVTKGRIRIGPGAQVAGKLYAESGIQCLQVVPG